MAQKLRTTEVPCKSDRVMSGPCKVGSVKSGAAISTGIRPNSSAVLDDPEELQPTLLPLRAHKPTSKLIAREWLLGLFLVICCDSPSQIAHGSQITCQHENSYDDQ